MQKDMHYYGTYAMAVAAGIPRDDAATIAYAAQYVDDATSSLRVGNADGSFLHGISTAHSPLQAASKLIKDAVTLMEEQRKVWIPFHFLPGAEGSSFHEKILCQKDSPVANKMFSFYIKAANDEDVVNGYELHLLGICAHVYMDTFAHYGFSGLSSQLNNVNQSKIVIKNEFSDQNLEGHILGGIKQLCRTAKGHLTETALGSLGHAGVDKCPDRPYLEWQFEFDDPRNGGIIQSERDNKATFLEGCRNLFHYFSIFAEKKYKRSNVNFNSIENPVKKLLAKQGREEERFENWKKSELCNGAPEYDPLLWEADRYHEALEEEIKFHIDKDAYKFHQAAAFHRYYVLKDLLPSFGIAAF